jgi:hypothetical protein
MADTKHAHGVGPVESDGVSYSGIVWFLVILTATTIACQIIVWAGFEFMEWRVDRSDAARPAVAAERARPAIDGGRIVTGTPESPQPSLLVDEPRALGAYRADEAAALSGYSWIDRSAGTVRIPIDRAKTLLLERGLPARPAPAASAAPGAAASASKPAPADSAPARPAAAGH